VAASIPLGIAVELHIEWPTLLAGVCPLELVVAGTVVRCERDAIALSVRSYRFRTKGTRAFHEAELRAGLDLLEA
jgi:hypothetical protein